MPIEISGWDDMSGEDDILGEDELLGADDDLRSLLAVAGEDDTSGRRLRALRRAVVKRQTATRMRRFPIGFQSDTPVGAFGSGTDTVEVKQSPQIAFRAERLVIPSEIASRFIIIDVKVGNRSQFVSSGAVPATVFSEVGEAVSLRMDTAQVSQEIVIRVQNISGGAETFRAAMVGTAVY
ncbi:MAG: hypothetical protein IT376_13810 [Polyangiaceae bacterium]|nr:hypothetical protein [Polyangiaceae bacterium]